MTDPLLTVVIDRKRWLRGGGGAGSKLYLNGKMCCLGFVGCALGGTIDQLFAKGSPRSVPSVFNRGVFRDVFVRVTTSGDTNVDTEITQDLIRANDCYALADMREEQLRSLFRRIGIAVEFEG